MLLGEKREKGILSFSAFSLFRCTFFNTNNNKSIETIHVRAREKLQKLISYDVDQGSKLEVIVTSLIICNNIQGTLSTFWSFFFFKVRFA